MSGNRFGELFSVSTFGESHGPAMGALIEGCPAGLDWRQDLLEKALQRRRPGSSSLVSARQELDQPEILSGVYQGQTLGTPIAILVRNQDMRSGDYAPTKMQDRRGHATDLWRTKYGHTDPRGSGRASGRETVSRVLGGAVARMLVERLHPGVRVVAFASAIGPVVMTTTETEAAHAQLREDSQAVDAFSARLPDIQKNQEAERLLSQAKSVGESYGGIVSVSVHGLPQGIGQPVFAKLKNRLCDAIMSIGATSGVELGEGFAGIQKVGSEFHSSTQEYGGIRGGISTGEAVFLRIAFKPTSSIGTIAREGRHDPCIVPRATPVVESMIWLVLADQVLQMRMDRL